MKGIEMKIIRVDNFNRETIPDLVIADNVLREWEGNIMLSALRNTCDPEGPYWYDLVPDDYQSYI